MHGDTNLNFGFEINQPIRCNSFTSLLLDVLFRPTCFGRLHAHHQEPTTALTASGFTLERGGSSVVSRGLAGQTTTNSTATTTLQNQRLLTLLLLTWRIW